MGTPWWNGNYTAQHGHDVDDSETCMDVLAMPTHTHTHTQLPIARTMFNDDRICGTNSEA